MEPRPTLITRRRAIAAASLAALSPSTFLFGEKPDPLSAALASIEKKSRGKLGCAVLDTSTGQRIGQRLDERFPMCSTFKVTMTAFILQRAEKGIERLDRKIAFSSKDLVTYSPVTEKHADGDGMTIAELCAAAITYSDNTASNLLLSTFGGPEALTHFLYSIGDPITRLDRFETSLNEATPGDPRDTTTPLAMLNTFNRLVLGDILSAPSRVMLTNWLVANTTGQARLRAGLPQDWKVGDKTGSGDHGTTNDIAIIWPPHRPPVLLTAYLTESPLSADDRNATLAEVGRSVASMIQST
jgi:beta-lactamase class A